MPRGVPVGTLAIGASGALNAALLAVSILALARPALARRLRRSEMPQPAQAEASRLPTDHYLPG